MPTEDFTRLLACDAVGIIPAPTAAKLEQQGARPRVSADKKRPGAKSAIHRQHSNAEVGFGGLT
jgi:hypothetical protein